MGVFFFVVARNLQVFGSFFSVQTLFVSNELLEWS